MKRGIRKGIRMGLFGVCAGVFVCCGILLAQDYASTRNARGSFAALAERLAEGQGASAQVVPAQAGASGLEEALPWKGEGQAVWNGPRATAPGGRDTLAGAAREGATAQGGREGSQGTAPPEGGGFSPRQAPTAAPHAPEEMVIQPQFLPLLAENPDLGGWITIPGTEVDYPVMYTPQQPEKYLRLSFEGKQSNHGVPFIGVGSTLCPRSQNIVVYGHHMNDGTMFAGLAPYHKRAYWELHPTLRFSTLYEAAEYDIFAVFLTDIYNARSLACYTFTNAGDEEEFREFIEGILQVSLYDTGITPQYGDELVTLSTCYYHTKDGRLVVMGRKRQEGQ